MRNQMFVFYLLLMLTLMSCSKTEIGFNGQVYLYLSEPEITRYPVEKMDSVVIKGFSACSTRGEQKGMLPENVVKDSGYDQSYTYYICLVSVNMKIKEQELIGLRYDESELIGYSSSEMDSGGYSSYRDRDDDKQQNLYVMHTYLVYITQDKNGKKMDVWYPYSPSELEWHCSSIMRSEVEEK